MYLARLIAKNQQVQTPFPPSASIPAPILGWNERDELSNMDPLFALELDNFFPDGNDIRLRGGNILFSSGFPADVETLHTASFGAVTKLVAFSGDSAFDATGGGTIGAPLITGLANARWIGANAGAAPGEKALYTNGVDPVLSYNGTVMVAAGITGVANPTGITVAHKRVWLIDKGTGDAYYLPPEAVAGAATKFSIGTVTPDGGELIAISSLTLDGGNGPEDLTVFVMKSGALIVYAGNDPSSAATWALRGVWKAGQPIGDRCLVPFGKDLILICTTGFQSILEFTTGGGISGVPISDNIRRAVNDATARFGSNFGWDGLYHAARRQLIFNIPLIENNSSEQFVMNSVDPRRPWCRFKGVNAQCQAVREERRFLGVEGTIWEADVGGVDLNEPIAFSYQSAWSYFQPRGREKLFKEFRPHIRSDSTLKLSTGFGTDFRDPNVTTVESSEGGIGAQWNISPWNADPWAGGLFNQRPWIGAANNGYNASVKLSGLTANVVVQLLATDVIYQPGSPL